MNLPALHGIICLSVAAFMAFAAAGHAFADEGKIAKPAFKTLGGKQLWTDHFIHGGWRIQRNVLTGHYRLLDDRDGRVTWGSYNQCRAEFERKRKRESLPALKSKVVITLHGLGRSRQSMRGIGQFLEQNSDLQWLNMSYCSTRDKLGDHAAALGKVIAGFEGVEEVNFVAHSMGNLVIRRYLHDLAQTEQLPPGYPRIGRIVMLAPPNGGAEMARRLSKSRLFIFVFGASGAQIADEWDELSAKLATPKSEFAIIAGSVDTPKGGNPAIAGPDDWIVSVEETRLQGARDFLVVKALHTIIMNQEKVRQACLRFLKHGLFEE